jgi:hypothetical protein
MINIKRSDRQYIDIEAFGDYELTHCIAYEMAIRNKRVIRVVKDFLEAYINYDRYEKFIGTTLDFDKADKPAQELLSFFINPFGLYLNYHFFDEVNNALEKIKKEEDKKYFVSTPLSFLLYSKKNYNDKFKNGNLLIQHKKVEVYKSLMVHQEEEKSSSIMRNDIEINYSRPLCIPRALSKEKNFILNINYPINELKNFIEKVKKDYDKDNATLLSISELLGEKLEKSDIKISKKKLADKFFVYDYVRARLEQIEEWNKETREKFNEEIQRVKNTYPDSSYKTTEINMLKESLRGDTINININDIFEEEELTNLISKGTARRYYYEMKPFIEDLKYKELVTGVQTSNTI